MSDTTTRSYQPPHISIAFTRLAPIHDQEWRENAACRGKNVNNWYPQAIPGNGYEDRQRALESGAKLVCRDCPVRTQCLHHAVTTDERYGIHGGLNYDERRALKRQAIA